MAISAVMAAVSTASAAISGTLMTAAWMGALSGTLIGHFLVSTALGAALGALSPKPGGAGLGGYSIGGESGAALDRQVIYGQVKVGGVRVYDNTTGKKNKFLHRILAFAGHEIESYEKIYVNDEEVTIGGGGELTAPERYDDGVIRMKTYLGTLSQSADSDLVAETTDLEFGRWTNAHRLTNIAYIYARLRYRSKSFPNGVPSISALVRGRKVYDPRTAVTQWSDNPALCIRDYLTNPVFGLGVPASRIDDDLVIAAANICDQTVEGEKRYSCNGAFVTSMSPSEVLRNMLTSMGGVLWYAQGKWRMRAAAYLAPSVNFGVSDLRGPVSVSTRHSRRQNFNIVRGKFRGPSTDWQVSDYPEVRDEFFIEVDNFQEQPADLQLAFTSSELTCQRLARIALNKNREQITVVATFGLRAMMCQVSDVVMLTLPRYGWDAKEFEVTDWKFAFGEDGDLVIKMTLRETSAAVYSSVPGRLLELNNTTLDDPYYVPPITVSVSTVTRIVNQAITNLLVISSSTEDETLVGYVEVQYRASGETEWIDYGNAPLGNFEVLGLRDNLYDVRVRAVNNVGVDGDWVEILEVPVAGTLPPPPQVSGLIAQVNGATLFLDWEPVADDSLSHYRVRYSPELSGAMWSGSDLLVERVSRPASSVTVPARAGTYLVKAVSKTGLLSDSAASVVVQPGDIETFVNSIVDDEHPSFSGTRTNVDLSGGELQIVFALWDNIPGNIDAWGVNVDDAGTLVAPGGDAEYQFSGYTDTGSVRRARVTVLSEHSRVATENSVDGLSSLWDLLVGQFDSLTGANDTDDTNVLAFVSSTSDDPAGSPTWSAWRQITVADLTGRAFRFKIRLQADADGVTPSLTSLSSVVSYN